MQGFQGCFLAVQLVDNNTHLLLQELGVGVFVMPVFISLIEEYGSGRGQVSICANWNSTAEAELVASGWPFTTLRGSASASQRGSLKTDMQIRSTHQAGVQLVEEP